jgi:hypothetical protein
MLDTPLALMGDGGTLVYAMLQQLTGTALPTPAAASLGSLG